MKFCTQCGASLLDRIPDGDDRLRKVCSSCGFVHYENPRIVTGCVIEHEGKLLLCRRAIEPSVGKWTPPAGYLEVGEGVMQGAIRESREEANVEVELISPLAQFDLPHIGQVYQLFRARLTRLEFSPGPESLEVELFEMSRIPWKELAFPVIHVALRALVADRDDGVMRLHLGRLVWSGEGSRFDPDQYRMHDHRQVPLT